MKIKIDGKLEGIDRKPIVSNPGTMLTFREVFVNSILTPVEGDDDKKKFEKWEIYKKLRDSKEDVILTVEELAVIKKCIGKFQPPLILGQCFELLEENGSEKKK